MMKLHYLHDKREMVHQILSLWPYDADRLDWLDRFRISSNAVYPFSMGGKLHFLRFAPLSEKRNGQIQAERSWLECLHAKGIEVNRMVPSHAGNTLEPVETEWGPCMACVFEGVEGQRYDWMDWQPIPEEALRAAGRTLAQLHRTGSSGLGPKAVRPWNWRQALDWCEQIATGIPVLSEGSLGQDEAGHPWPETRMDSEAVHAATKRLREIFSALPSTPDVYGPVHYDFEMDNLFWQPDADRCVPIDFDDLMLHWYAMDLVKSLESIRETVADKQEEAGAGLEDPAWSDVAEEAESFFLEGYRSMRPVPVAWKDLRPAFSQFAALYGYARILYSVAQVGTGEPDWMTGLRSHLRELLEQRKAEWVQAL